MMNICVPLVLPAWSPLYWQCAGQTWSSPAWPGWQAFTCLLWRNLQVATTVLQRTATHCKLGQE